MRERILAIAMIALAAVALPRLRLEYAPHVSFPELAVMLRLPPTANIDSAETTRRWVIPIESALRAIGDTTGTRGEVEAGAATITARFKRGTDIELKAARLASDLAPLRARLPEYATLAVFPSRGGVRPSAVLAISGQPIAEELRSTPGVRDVQTSGTARDEIDVQSEVDPATIVAALTPRPLGKKVIAAPAARRIRDLPMLAGAEIRLRREEPSSIARLNGRPAAIVNVFRDDEAPLLSFDRNVRQVVGTRGTVIWSDAAELRAILWRLAIAAMVAMLILAINGEWLYVPLAVALVINVWRVASMRVDARTLAMTAIAIAAIAPFAVLRKRWPALFVLLLPIAALFGSGDLAPLLTPAARDFAVAACCALAATLLDRRRPRRLDRRRLGGETPPGQPPGRRRSVKPLLRHSASVVLACLAAAIFLLSWYGARLDPRRSQGSADHSRVFVRLRLPSGTTLGQTTRAAESIERALQGLHGVKRFWTLASPGAATVVIEIDPRIFDLFQIALRARIPAGNATIDVQGSAPSALAESIEEQPFADEDGAVYRFLLKGTDADALRRAAEGVTARIARGDVPRENIRSEWPEPSPRIELVPRPSLSPAVADADAAELARLSLPPAEQELPNGTILRVAGRDAPRNRDDVPRRAALFARPLRDGLVVESAFEARMASSQSGVTRELGRFVLPIDVTVRAPSRDQALAKRLEIDRGVGLFPWPAGVIAERPQLAAWNLSMAKVRLAAVAAFLPLLLFTAAAIALASLARAFVALAPAAVAVAFVAPVLAAASARLDEMTLLATGAAVCCVAALAVATLLHVGRVLNPSAAEGGRFAAADGLRTRPTSLLRFVTGASRPFLIATLAGGALILIAATARPAIGDAWRAPLFAAATIVIVGTPAALFLPSAIDLLFRDLARRRGAVTRPAVWRDADAVPHLSVRNVTKVYASGFRALHRVSFDLTPGVVGLLGPNGAGKTTLLRILTGLLRPTRGALQWCGVPVAADNLAEFRRSIGFLPQEFNAYAGLTAAQFLDFWALERGIDSRARAEQIEELLAVVGLEEHANRRVRDFSGGMRQRIGIARALLGDPPLLVVDEPTTGLDIEARRRFRDLLIALARNRIVIVSSHIAGDVETTAIRLLLLARGELRFDGPVEGLLARARGRVFEAVVTDAELRLLAQQVRITTRVRVADGIRIRGVVAEGQALPGAEVTPSLEEAYLSEVSTGAIRRGSFAFVFSSS
jgi:ABC-type multidrug transport system ATPase subunit